MKIETFLLSHKPYLYAEKDLIVFEGQPSSHQGNQIQVFGCLAFGIGTT